MNAARIAGLEATQIINEPTAAAIAYGLQEAAEDAQNVLVFDLGGGTFDVTIVSIDNGVFEVKATHGDTHLGGEDFDNLLIDLCKKKMKEELQIDMNSNSIKALRRLRTCCESVKRELSSQPQATINYELGDDDFTTVITRAQFEEMCSGLFKRCIECLDQAL